MWFPPPSSLSVSAIYHIRRASEGLGDPLCVDATVQAHLMSALNYLRELKQAVDLLVETSEQTSDGKA